MEKKYTYIREYILKQIQTGVYMPGHAIPSERELAAQFQVNRMTIRKAIEELMYEGLLIRKKGSGTFLTEAKSGKDTWTYTEEVSGEERIRIISCKPGNEISYGYKALQIEVGTPYWRMRRVRMSQGIPYAYEDIYFHPEFFEKLSRQDYGLGLRQLVARYVPDHSAVVYEDVEALLCLQSTAALLKVNEGSPILQIKSYFEQDGKILMHCRSYHPGDSYKYQSNPVVI